VLCAQPKAEEGDYPQDQGSKIKFFAVPKATNVDFAMRFADITQAALVSGLVVQFGFNSGDTSGQTFGCAPENCRTPVSISLLAANPNVRIPFAVWPNGSSVSIAQSQWQQYGPFSISKFRKLVVQMTGTGDADLYVQQDGAPDEIHFICRPFTSTANETCTVMTKPAQGMTPEELTGTYFVGVKGYSPATYSLSVSVQTR
jgi:hypothetical protein